MTFDPKRLLTRLREQEIRFVVIGGVAGVLHGSPYATSNVDICAASDSNNLEALAAALRSLDAREWDPEEEVETERQWFTETLRGQKVLSMATSLGHLNVFLEPPGVRDYEKLAKGAVEYEISGGPIAVAHIDDVIRMKEMAGRDSDRVVLPTLRKLAERRLAAGSDSQSDAESYYFFSRRSFAFASASRRALLSPSRESIHPRL